MFLIGRKDRLLDGRLRPVCLGLFQGVQFVQALDEQQVGELFRSPRADWRCPPDHMVSQMRSTFDLSSPVIMVCYLPRLSAPEI